MQVTLPLSAVMLGRVVYKREDTWNRAPFPQLLQQLTITGQAEYSSFGGNLSEAALYVRASLDNLPPTCTPLPPDLVVCDVAGEAGQAVGTLNLAAGERRPFTLTGPALDQAGKAGHTYFGLRVVQGSSLPGEELRLTGMKANARLPDSEEAGLGSDHPPTLPQPQLLVDRMNIC